MSQTAAIKAELKLHPDVQTLDDEWSGIIDPVVRRKLQNRLNQRAARRRKGLKSNGGQLRGHQDREKETSEHDVARISCKSSTVDAKRPTTKGDGFVDRRPGEFEALGRRLLLEASTRSRYPLSADHLLSLVYYNVYRGLVTNIKLVGLDFSKMCRDDYISLFVGKLPTDPSFQRIPPSFRPTNLQCTVTHHPMWDIFPDPVLRDNVLALCDDDSLDEDELCLDLVGDGTANASVDVQSNAGMLVWDEPWDIRSWEVTERFARKWGWLVKDSFSLWRSTNDWRKRRGEAPLRCDFTRKIL